MNVQHRYFKSSHVQSTHTTSSMSFSPDTSREPAYLVGEIRSDRSVAFREAISAMHDVVMSDMRFKADNADYKLWRAQQDAEELETFLKQELSLRKIEPTKETVDVQRLLALAAKQPGLRARSRELRKQREALYPEQHFVAQEWELLWHAWHTMNPALGAFFIPKIYDPVITVHPKQVFFECFSLDESSYARLTCSTSIFSSISKSKPGTTNIDYSQELYDEFQKIRSYKTTSFAIDPKGFEVQTNEEEEGFFEQKIELPESWIRGFLQVSAAMQLPSNRLRLHPLDVHKLCLFLHKHKELEGPRSIRFILRPNEAPIARFEPWNEEVTCLKSEYFGQEEQEVRLWGRRRLLLLERLIPITDHFDMFLAGKGLPYFFVAHMGEMQLTLGFSSWTKNNFSDSARFDLLAPREPVSEQIKQQIYAVLKEKYSISVDALAQELAQPHSTILSALSQFVQAGRAIYDLVSEEYQLRELMAEPLDMSTLQFSSPEEAKAIAVLQLGAINEVEDNPFVVSVADRQGIMHEESGVEYTASLFDGRIETRLVIDDEGNIDGSSSSCTCRQDYYERISGGACPHILALRLHTSRPMAPVIVAGQTKLALVGSFETSLPNLPAQCAHLQIEQVQNVSEADVLLVGTCTDADKKLTDSFSGVQFTQQQWSNIVESSNFRGDR